MENQVISRKKPSRTQIMQTNNFKSIALLTDFSEAAKNSIRYAVDAFGDEVQYHLVNSFYARSSSATLIDLNDVLAKESEAELTKEKKWMTETFSKLNLKVKTHSIFGSPVDAVKKLKRVEALELIIMGTKGATGLAAVLFGSVAAHVIRNTIVPVISVPPLSKFSGFTHMVFATDSKVSSIHSVEPIQKIQDKFNSKLDIVTVDVANEGKDIVHLEPNLLKAKHVCLEGKQVAETVVDYCHEIGADLLVVLPKHTGIFNRLFHHSISKELVQKAQLPILSLEND